MNQKINNFPKTILIADDDYDLLEQMKIHLEAKGYKVITAETQKEAEQKIEKTEPDLAIFDLMMEHPDSGFLLSYKTKKKYPHIPVILCTGVTAETGLKFDTSTEETRSWTRADVILNKEIRYEQLDAEIERFLKG